MRFALAYNPIRPPGPIPLWLPPDGLPLLNRLAVAVAGDASANHYFSDFTAREFDPDSVLTVGELRIRFHPTKHYVPCWAMRVSNGRDGDLFYTADTGPSANFDPFASGSRVVVAEATARSDTLEPPETRGHLTPSEAAALAKHAQASVLVLSHLWAENDQFAACDEAQRVFGGPVELATPGLTLNWPSAPV